MVSCFLQGRNKQLPVEVIDNIYSNEYSSATYRASEEVQHQLFLSTDPYTIPYARPSLSAWATHHVAQYARLEIGSIANSLSLPSDKPNLLQHFHLSLNGCRNRQLITWDDLKGFRIEDLAKTLEKEAPLPWYLLQQMAAPSEKDQLVVRK